MTVFPDSVWWITRPDGTGYASTDPEAARLPSPWVVRRYDHPGEPEGDEVNAIRNALGLLASCVRSGESWSPAVSDAVERAKAAVKRLAAAGEQSTTETIKPPAWLRPVLPSSVRDGSPSTTETGPSQDAVAAVIVESVCVSPGGAQQAAMRVLELFRRTDTATGAEPLEARSRRLDAIEDEYATAGSMAQFALGVDWIMREASGSEEPASWLASTTETATGEVQRLREAITDALADLTPGISPYSVLDNALRPAAPATPEGER